MSEANSAKEKSSESCSSEQEVMLLSCSGGSNVGQLSNQAAVELTQEGFGKMFCLAGIGGQLPSFVKSAKEAPMVVAIDGCQVGCAKAILKQADVLSSNYVVITEEGIEKNKNLDLSRENVERVKNSVRLAVDKNRPDGN